MTTCNELGLRPVVQGDVNQHKQLEVGGVEDLNTVVSIVAILRKGRVVETITDVTVTDPIARIVDIDFGDATGWLATEATPGGWELQLEFTTIDTAVTTWPDAPPYILNVVASNA